nr:C-type lectin domain family 4 member E-like [Dromaius novaehollandiae]
MGGALMQSSVQEEGCIHTPEDRSYSRLRPWVFLVSALVIKVAFLTICLVVFHHQSYDQYKTLLQNATEWHCVPNTPAEEGWTCCPMGWRLFQKSCYYVSSDEMSWGESEKNCTGMGSHLVVISTEVEQPHSTGILASPPNQFCSSWTLHFIQDFLFSLVKRTVLVDSIHCFHSCQCIANRGTFVYSFWKPGEPNLPFDKKCVAIHVKGNTDSSTYSNWNNMLSFTICFRICELTAKYV